METSKSLLFGNPQSAVYSEEDLYRIAASVEQNANHPLAKAIVLAAQEKSRNSDRTFSSFKPGRASLLILIE